MIRERNIWKIIFDFYMKRYKNKKQNPMIINGFSLIRLLTAILVIGVTSGTEDAVQNVALHKKTYTSSNFSQQYNFSRAVDGVTDDAFCIDIEQKGNTWWGVNLGETYTILSIRIILAKVHDSATSVIDNICETTPDEYRGTISTTIDGIPCQRWDTQIPHKHELGVNLPENFCRDPDDHGQPWCFTTDPRIRFQRCNVWTANFGHVLNVLQSGKRDCVLQTGGPSHIREYFWPGNSRATIVGFYIDETERHNYSLCEIEVFGIKGAVSNVALRKTASMSSVPYDMSGPSRAVDGLLNQQFHEGYCFRTANERDPWWQVDLDSIYVIFSVMIYNRVDCCGSRAHDLVLKLGTSFKTMQTVWSIEGPIKNVQMVVLPTHSEARYVQVIRQGLDSFHLCEVEVYGKIANCEYNPCKNGGKCSVQQCGDPGNCRQYKCACSDGYGGIDCEVCTQNVAVGKQIEASSNDPINWFPSNVIDGNTDQFVSSGSTCVSTQTEVKPYIILDLMAEYSVTGVSVYKRLDCCAADIYSIELFLLLTTWTSLGNTDGRFENITMFEIYPYVDVRLIKLEAVGEQAISLQVCEIQVFGVCHEASERTAIYKQSRPFIQMRFELLDEYSDVVLSEMAFRYSVTHHLSNQTSYPMQSFQNTEVQKDPLRVSFELHSADRDMETLNEMLENFVTMFRSGMLDIKNEYGRHLRVKAGSLNYQVIENEGTRIGGSILTVVCIVLLVKV